MWIPFWFRCGDEWAAAIPDQDETDENIDDEFMEGKHTIKTRLRFNFEVHITLKEGAHYLERGNSLVICILG